MKTRSEWGSNFDWDEYDCLGTTKHESSIGKNYYKASIGLAGNGEANTREEARRCAVELALSYYKEFSLPWRPDYDLSTEAGCREAIRANGYDEAGAGVMGMRIWLYVKGKEVKQIDEPIAPSLGLWQKAAQYAIDNPA